MTISQTDFIDFISKTGFSKLSKVRNLLNRPDYHPSFDFYKPLREEIKQSLIENKDKKDFNKLFSTVSSKKWGRYQKLIDGYLRFLGRKRIVWFQPPSTVWVYKELRVKMNPELGIVLNDDKYIIKLYFKDSPLDKKYVEVLLWMMEETLCDGIYKGYKCAVLDLERNKLHRSKEKDPELRTILENEADYLLKLWSSLEKKSA